MRSSRLVNSVLLLLAVGAASVSPARADEFTQDDLKRWEGQFMEVVKQGRDLWTRALGSNGVSCAQCHPNAANTRCV